MAEPKNIRVLIKKDVLKVTGSKFASHFFTGAAKTRDPKNSIVEILGEQTPRGGESHTKRTGVLVVSQSRIVVSPSVFMTKRHCF